MEHRLAEFIAPAGRSLILDTSAGLSLGVLPGLAHFAQDIQPFVGLASGLVCSPGQIGRLQPLHKGDAGLLVRMDWNNTLRGADFTLPPTTPQRVALLTAADALDLGACGMVTTILLGYDEEVEAASIRATVQLALSGKPLGLPLVAEVRPTGPRVALFGKAVELGASYALEGGADVIVVPHPGKASLATLGKFVSVPWFVKPTSLQAAQSELAEALSAGAAGLWLDHAVFALPDPLDFLTHLRSFQPAGLAENSAIQSAPLPLHTPSGGRSGGEGAGG